MYAPDILIVDEILAVGDYAFQTKCLERIQTLQKQGVTIIFVSHHLQTVRQLCSHLVWLEHGKMRTNGTASEVAEQYLAHFSVNQQVNIVEGNRWGTGEVEITSVRFLNEQGQEKHSFSTGDRLSVEMGYMAHQSVHNPEFGLAFFTIGWHFVG